MSLIWPVTHVSSRHNIFSQTGGMEWKSVESEQIMVALSCRLPSIRILSERQTVTESPYVLNLECTYLFTSRSLQELRDPSTPACVSKATDP